MPDKIVDLSKSTSYSDTTTGSMYYIREDGSVYGTGRNTYYQLLKENTVQLNYVREVDPTMLEVDRVNYLKIGSEKTLDLNIQQNFNLYAKNPSLGKITWESSNEAVAVVDQNGKVTAVAEGKAVIRAKEEKYGYIATSVVYVIRNTENTITMPQVVQGLNYTAVLRADGTVWTAGANELGQCGIGERCAVVGTLTQVERADGSKLDNIVKIASGYNHVLALTKDGEVYAWGGNNTYGELGQGNNTASDVAVKVQNSNGTGPITNIIDISAGLYHSTLLNNAGEVYQFGHNTNGQIGDGTKEHKNLPTKTKDLKNIVQIATGGQYFMTALKTDGTVWAVGYNAHGQLGINSTASPTILPRQVMNSELNGPLKGIVEIANGRYHALALTEDKIVYAWGNGTDGQLGQNNVENKLYPTLVEGPEGTTGGLKNIVKLGTSERISFFVTNTGEIYGTGENANYQLAQKVNTAEIKLPTKMYYFTGEEYIDNVLNVVSSSVNINNTAVIRKDGSVWVTGLGAHGQIGNETYETVKYYTKSGNAKLTTDLKHITIAKGQTAKINTSAISGFNVYEDEIEEVGSLTITVQNPEIINVSQDGTITGLNEGRSVVTVYDTERQEKRLVIVKVTDKEEEVAQPEIASGEHAVLLKSDGTVWTWGNNTYGQLGNGTIAQSLEPVQVLDTNGVDKLKDVIGVASGLHHSVALKKDGTVVTWGYNAHGELGEGTKGHQSIPKYVIDEQGNKLTGIIKISAGNYHTVALKEDGTVWTWGNNSYGQLGVNNFVAKPYAVQVKDTTGKGFLANIADVSAGAENTVALTHDKEVWAWGYNYYGQLGTGSATRGSNAASRSLPTPRKSNITGVDQIMCGTYHVTVIKEDGTIWGWGYNGHGELSQGTTTEYYLNPVQMKLDADTYLKDVVDMGRARFSVHFKLKDGTVLGVGYNGCGQLGNNEIADTVIYPVEMKNVYGETYNDKFMYLGKGNAANTSYFIRKDGTIFGTGTQSQNRMLNTRTTNITTPLEIKPDVVELSKRNVTLKQGESENLTVSIKENLNAYTSKISVSNNISFTSMDQSIVTVDNTGKITAVGLGETIVKFKDEVNGYEARAVVSVIQNHENAIAVPQVVQGSNYTLILKADGTVWGTGLNASGQLGNGTTVNKTKPERVRISSKEYLKDVIKISAGQDHAVALTKNGEVYTWGVNTYGELGNGTKTNSVYAVKVLDSSGIGYLDNIIDVSSGRYETYALTEDGTVYAWGRNNYYQLGNGTAADQVLPVKMLESENTIKISSADANIMLLGSNGKLRGIGYNPYGQTGNETTSTQSKLEYVKDSSKVGVMKNVYKIINGRHHYMAMTEDGKVYGWGYNGQGQLLDLASPVKLPSEIKAPNENETIIDIGASYYNSIIKTKDANGNTHVYASGYNNYGQIGNGTVVTPNNSWIPVQNSTGEKEAEGLDILTSDCYGANNSGYIDINGNVWTVRIKYKWTTWR